MKIKRILTLLLCVTLVSLAACGDKGTAVTVPGKYSLPKQLKTTKSDTVAENSNYTLLWDNEKYCISLKSKADGTVWSTIPYGYYTGEHESSKYVDDGLCSGIRITYVKSESNETVEINSNSDAEYILARKLKSGALRVTYYFDSVGISVPILYELTDDGVSVSLEIAGITEGKNKIIKVSFLPFFASAKNADGNYLFVPSGSGALINTQKADGTTVFYSEPVYGEDMTVQPIYRTVNTESVRMPVFGAKNGENSLFAIITEGDDIADICATAGDSQYGYSGVYASFNLRGSSSQNIKGLSNKNSSLIKYSDRIVSLKKATAAYIPLKGEKSDYNGMAETYRNYLANNKGLKSDVSVTDAVLNVYGGAKLKKLFCGIPYNTFSVMTKISDTEKIIDELNKSGISLAVNLQGFGSDGVDSEKIGGGFSIERKLGTKKQLAALNKKCSDNGVDLFYDFSTALYSKSSSGFSVRSSATEPSGIRAKVYPYTLVVREQDTTDKSFLAGRDLLTKSTEKIISTAKKFGISGIGLSDISSISYSDYRSSDYYCKANTALDAEKAIKAVTGKKYKTFGMSANSYAAAKLDYIFNTPVKSSKYNLIDRDIPFYQMVFRGSSVITGETVNLSEEPEIAFLNSVSLGCALGFSVCGQVDISLVKAGGYSFAAQSVYSGISDKIKQYSAEIKPVLEKIGGSYISSYERNGDIAVTYFSNGLVVAVNFGKETTNTDYGEIPPRAFIYR